MRRGVADEGEGGGERGVGEGEGGGEFAYPKVGSLALSCCSTALPRSDPKNAEHPLINFHGAKICVCACVTQRERVHVNEHTCVCVCERVSLLICMLTASDHLLHA